MDDRSCGIKNCQREMALKEMQESDDERCPDRKHLVTEKCRSLIHPPKRGSTRRSTSPERRGHSPRYHASYDYSYTASSSKLFPDKVKQRFENKYGAADNDRTFSQELVYGPPKRKMDKSCGIKNCEREMALKEMQESDEERCPDRKHLVTEKCLSIIHPPKRGSYRRSTSQRTRNEPIRRDQFSIYRADYDHSTKTGIPYSDKNAQHQKISPDVEDIVDDLKERVDRTDSEERHKDARHQNVPTEVKEVVHDLRDKVHRTTSGERLKARDGEPMARMPLMARDTIFWARHRSKRLAFSFKITTFATKDDKQMREAYSFVIILRIA
ncbi:hypothetical protein TNCV_2225001 [Trichonephila clavipes]|nr:hypothetical protein TNCV_2225001 [Trichonephila clavipes]